MKRDAVETTQPRKRRYRRTEFHYYDWDFNRWFGSETRARCRALGGILALAAEGAYKNLLDYCYQAGDVPADIEGLAALSGCSVEEFEKLWPAFRDKFRAAKSKKGRLVNDEALMRRRAFEKQLRHNSEAGSKSGEKRRINKSNDDNGLSNGCSTGVERVFNHEERSKKYEERSIEESSAVSVQDRPVSSDVKDPNGGINVSTSTAQYSTVSVSGTSPVTTNTVIDFASFRAKCERLGATVSDEEWRSCREFEWKALTLDEKTDCLNWLEEGHANGKSLAGWAPKNIAGKKYWKRSKFVNAAKAEEAPRVFTPPPNIIRSPAFYDPNRDPYTGESKPS